MEKTKVIFSLRVARQLTKKGHKIIKRKPNLDKPHLDVFIFRATEEFENDLQEVMDNMRSQ